MTGSTPLWSVMLLVTLPRLSQRLVLVVNTAADSVPRILDHAAVFVPTHLLDRTILSGATSSSIPTDFSSSIWRERWACCLLFKRFKIFRIWWQWYCQAKETECRENCMNSGGGSVGKCGRLRRHRWRLLPTIICLYLLTYLFNDNRWCYSSVVHRCQYNRK